jgi:hypothetical protein
MKPERRRGESAPDRQDRPDHKKLYRLPGPGRDWKQAAPVKVTEFPESAGLFLEDPQISSDGKQLLYSRGKITGDIRL